MPNKVEIPEDELRMFYLDDKLSGSQIAEYYDVTDGTIYNRMAEYKIERRSLSEATKLCKPVSRKYCINEDFFKHWSTDSAWLYGWALSDGGFTVRTVLTFGLSDVDIEVLYKFKKCLDSQHPVTKLASWDKRYEKMWRRATVHFTSVALVEDLKMLDYTTIPLKFVSHFIRGIFEGDGSVFWNRNTRAIGSDFSGSNYELLEHIYYWLKDVFGIVEKGGIYDKVGDCYGLMFAKYDTLALYDFLYEDCGDNFLERKKKKFEEPIEKGEVK